MRKKAKSIVKRVELALLMTLLKTIFTVFSIIDVIVDWFKDADAAIWKFRVKALGSILLILMLSGAGVGLIVQASHSPDLLTVYIIRIIGVFMIVFGIMLGASIFPSKTSSDEYYYPYSR